MAITRQARNMCRIIPAMGKRKGGNQLQGNPVEDSTEGNAILVAPVILIIGVPMHLVENSDILF